MDHVLDVEEAAHAEPDAQPPGVVGERSRCSSVGEDGREDRDAVAGVDPGPLDVLHDPGDQHVLAVADGVNLDLAALEVLVDQDRAAGRRSRLPSGRSRSGRSSLWTISIAQPPST